MPTGTINVAASIAGLSIQTTRTRTASGQISHEVSLPAATAGTLATRTGDDEGVFTLAGHDLLVNDVIDVYWASGVRYGMKVTAVSGNDVTAGGISGPGAGDVLPAVDTAVAVGQQVEVDTDFDGDKLEMIMIASTRRGHFDFQASGGSSLEAQELRAGEQWEWCSGVGITNPLASGVVDVLMVSNGDSSGAATLKMALIYNSDQ